MNYLQLYRIPKNLQRANLWLQNMKLTDWTPAPTDRFCSKHFEKCMFYTISGQVRLLDDAVPTILRELSTYMEPKKVPTNTLQSRWDTLFEKNGKEWIAFKPAQGLYVYTCYSCRHMFHSRKSFLDHANRRAVSLQYKCSNCNNEDLKFYNRCSLLLHCRRHYGLNKGTVNLNNLTVDLLPLGLAGFSKHPDIPYLFDVPEEPIPGDTFVNSQFYTPRIEDRGKEIISLTPRHLVVNRVNQNGECQALALKQVDKNIPKCQFISMDALKELRALMNAINRNESSPVDVKSEIDDSQTERITFSEEPGISLGSPERPQRIGQPQNSLASVPSPPFSISQNRPEVSTVDLDNFVMPVITKIETVEEPLRQTANVSGNRTAALSNFFNNCSECDFPFSGSLHSHFLGENRPVSEDFRCRTCKLICPTACSFKAHCRIHEKLPPFVCPDCGEDFSDAHSLAAHMDEVCFHMTKSVRYRCPGRRCGKIFASDATFGPHFKLLHIETLYMCGSCKDVFTQLEDCEEHCLTHPGETANIVKMFSCPTCAEEDMNWHQLKKHLDIHCKDLSRCIYIYMCKFCKCYFRSVQTITTHLQNCRVQKTGISRRVRATNSHNNNFIQSKYNSGQCKLCRNKIIFLKSKPSSYCSKCLVSPSKSPAPIKKQPSHTSDKCVCILCKLQIDFDSRRRHQQECKYAKPQVLVERLDIDNAMDTAIHNISFSSSNSDVDVDGSPHSRPRKRHKPSKPKKPEMENDLIAEKPIPFDGTYQCRSCEYKNTDRKHFHQHVKIHRHISTAYQCMECGECFVVRPSLVKHLLHYHNISNFEQYFMENDCFDQNTVIDLNRW